LLIGVGQRAAVVLEQDDAGGGPECRKRVAVVAQGIGAIEGAFDEGKRDARGLRARAAHTVNEEPQPQVVLAFGLRITNCAPCRLSL